MTIFTAAPDFLESIAATGSRYRPPIPLPPNPPPISMGMIFTRDTGIPRMAEVWSLKAKSCCVLHQTVTLPSLFQKAVVAWGSM